jgi:site-specific DNA recombinase
MTRQSPQHAAVYLRISQDRDGESMAPERQRDLLRKKASELGWQIGTEYLDLDLSAYSRKRRPDWERMLADLAAGVADGVLAVDQDRLLRRVDDVVRLIGVAEPRSAPVLLLSGEIDTTTADGRLRAHILASVAEHESAKKSERERRQRDQAATKGLYQGGRRPYGYAGKEHRDRDTKMIAGVTIIADEAKIIRQIARQFIKGESVNAIARDLNERGVKPPHSAEWKATTVRSLVGSPRLAGLRVHHGAIAGKAEWKPILTMEQHGAIVERLESGKRSRGGRPETALLSNVLRCGLCGVGLVVGVRAGGGRRYRCYSAPGHAGCGRLTIEADKTDEYVTELVLTALDDSDIPKPTDRGRSRDAELADIADRETNLARLYASGELEQHEWSEARRMLRTRRRALGNEPTERKPPAVLWGRRSVRKAWPDLTHAERREVVGFVVESIDVFPASAPRWDAGRLADPVWRI